jgi:hypothetical protein
MKPESVLLNYRWLNVLPGMLLISLVVLFFWFLGAVAIIGSGGSIEEQARHTYPIAVERGTPATQVDPGSSFFTPRFEVGTLGLSVPLSERI